MEKNYIYQENGLFGVKDITGKIIISPQYREMYDFCCGLSLVRNERFQYAYINEDNEQIVPFGKYIWCDPQFVCGFARVKSNEKWGIIDTLGNIVVPLKYDKIWTIKEEYIFSVKAFVGEKEILLNLHEIQKWFIFDGLKYIKTYSVEEFKELTNCEHLYVRKSLKDNQLFFSYGSNIGRVALSSIPLDPVIAVVSNSSGKIFPLLMEKTNIGKTFLPIANTTDTKEHSSNPSSHNIFGGNYDSRAVRDAENWSDPYNDEQDYYDGWSREDVESGLSDAYEGDLSARWNTD